MAGSRWYFSLKVVTMLVVVFAVPVWCWISYRNIMYRPQSAQAPWVPMPPLNPVEFVTIAMSAVTVVLAVLAVLIAIMAVWGYKGLKDEAGNIARSTVELLLADIKNASKDVRPRDFTPEFVDVDVTDSYPKAFPSKVYPDVDRSPSAVADKYPEDPK